MTLRGISHGRSARSVIFFSGSMLIAAFARAESSSAAPDSNDELLAKVLLAIAGVVIASIVVPLVRFFYQKQRLRATYRTYLLTHVSATLGHFQGVGSTHFAGQHLLENTDAEWFQFLTKHNLGVPDIFVSIQTVLKRTRAEDKYIPSITYIGFDRLPMDHTNPVWELAAKESKAALAYLVTQQQLESSLDYQYGGWYFDLVKVGDQKDRERWCLGMENTLLDLAQHYKAARELRSVLQPEGA